ncbi:helix-turn-helix domain-containing protein [Streptomycetaceae bacterium NBC_01309]
MAARTKVQEIPTTSWLLSYLGREIRIRRENAGLTQTELGARTFCSPKLVSAIESGTRVPQPAFINLADAGLGADGALNRLWRAMTDGETVTPYEWYVFLEEQASKLCHFEPMMIPGLLQTEEYARAIFALNQPPMGQDRIDAAVARRLARQSLFTRDNPPNVWIILDEAAIRRWPGDRVIMERQIQHMLEIADLPNVTLLAIPFAHGLHCGLQGFMAILSFEDGDDCGYVEPISGGQIVYDPTIVATMHRSYDLLRAAALPPEGSARLLRKALEDL